LQLSWIGHSTVLVESGGTRILTDPLLRNRAAYLRRVQPVGAPPEDIDAVLVSHAHYDHLDIPSLRRLGPMTRLVVPRGVGKVLRRRGFADVVEVEPGEEVEVGHATVRATPAEHARVRRGPNRSLALGYVVGASAKVYFAGDTDLFAGMAELPPIDVALLPVWGWGPRLGAGHLDPQRAAESLTLLRPRIAIPIHWGTYRPAFRRTGLFLSQPALRFREAAARLAPDVDVRILAPGESFAVATGSEEGESRDSPPSATSEKRTPAP
jgi:L-ascorbate metabolism protein UlaG (beta-lactamase superfamily)